MANGDGSQKRRFVIIGVSSFLLVAMVVAVTLGVSLNEEEQVNGRNNAEVTASVKAIKSICAPTDYKKTCEESLIKNGGHTTDPKELIKVAFNVTMNYITEATKKSGFLEELKQDPRAHIALEQCKELMEYSIGDLKNSLEIVGSFDVNKIDQVLANLKIWLSAAISQERTCLDGFQDTEGDAGEKMKQALKTALMLTHNGLAIVNEIAKAVGQMNLSGASKRRLLVDKASVIGHGDEIPEWLDPIGRKLLTDKVSVIGHGDDISEWLDPIGRKLLAASPSQMKPDFVVAKDGSGQFKTINEAIKQMPRRSNKTIVLYIKQGVYKEVVEISRNLTRLMIIGDGADKTRITGDLSYSANLTTYKTATFAVVGDFFIAKNIGFENTAGAVKHQAVALRVQSDMSIFYNCSMDGYQDTLYALSKRQFYRDCTISGTIDFIFGDAAAVFQNCKLVVRKPLDNQQCPMTAHGRQDWRESTGFVFQGCTIVGEPDYLAVKHKSRAFLGRPWKPYSRAVFMNSYIPDFVNSTGWMPWNGNFGLDTCYYAEVNNEGPGADLSGRVKWPGIKKLTEEMWLSFTPGRFIQGDFWIPFSRVPYTSNVFSAEAKSPSPASFGPVS